MTEAVKQPSFIEEYFLSEEICTQIIEYFEACPGFQRPGMVGTMVTDDIQVDETIKKSTDMFLEDGEEFFYRYFAELVPCIRDYCNKYKINIPNNLMGYMERTNIQRYLPNQGYFGEHFERSPPDRIFVSRELVFMTYLNTIRDFSENQGATVFPFQHVVVKPVIGKTLIWPAGFTHRHYGVTHKTETKYIVTGWKHFKIS